jgi:hypothetical protein
MDKDVYAAMFADSDDAAVNYIEVRIVTTDADSESALGQVSDTFAIELSLGCTDDRIVPPPAIPMAEMLMESGADGSSIAADVVVDLGVYETLDPACQDFASIVVDRFDQDT